MPSKIPLLHVRACFGCRRRERREPRADCVVGTRLDLDVVGGIGVVHVDGLALAEPIGIRWLGAVPAEQSMVAENPEIARLGDRVVRCFGNHIGIGLYPRSFQRE